ncbi:regulator of G-protein signaling 3-like [Arapaima gigas]
MLVTREDEPGRCNVLQNPLFLQHLRLRDDPTEELRFYIIHMTEKCDCLLSLEAYSAEQKRRFCQCLGDHIEKQLQRRETPSTTEKMLEPKADMQCELGGQQKPEEEQHTPSSPSEPPAPGSPPLEDLLTPLEEVHTSPEDEHKVPPTPPPSTEGEDCKSTEGEVWQEAGEMEDEKEMEEVTRGGERPDVEEVAQPSEEDNCSEAADTGALPSSSSSSFVIPKLRLDRSFSADALSSPATDDEDYGEDEEEDEEEEDEEDDDEEDDDEEAEDSDDYLERSDSKRRSVAEAAPCERHGGVGGGGAGLSVQGSLRRRTHSEGSLLQEPRAPCFASDDAINRLDAGVTRKAGWSLPSPRTLKKELTKNGGSMHQLCMLLSGRKLSGGSDCSCNVGPDSLKKKKSKNLSVEWTSVLQAEEVQLYLGSDTTHSPLTTTAMTTSSRHNLL